MEQPILNVRSGVSFNKFFMHRNPIVTLPAFHKGSISYLISSCNILYIRKKILKDTPRRLKIGCSTHFPKTSRSRPPPRSTVAAQCRWSRKDLCHHFLPTFTNTFVPLSGLRSNMWIKNVPARYRLI